MPARYKKRKIKGVTYSEHRLVWEKAHGPIPEGYIVHHKNGDKFDNRLENLEILTHAEHSRHHNDKHPRVKVCESCGKSYEPNPQHRFSCRASGRCGG